MTVDVLHTKALCFGLWSAHYLDRGTYTTLPHKLRLDLFHLQTSPQIFLLYHQMKTRKKISWWVFSACRRPFE